MNNAVMARAFAIATERGLTIMSHAEDREISPWDYRLAENIETVRNCHPGRILRHAAAYVPRLHEGIRGHRADEPDEGCAGQLRGHAPSPVV